MSKLFGIYAIKLNTFRMNICIVFIYYGIHKTHTLLFSNVKDGYMHELKEQ